MSEDFPKQRPNQQPDPIDITPPSEPDSYAGEAQGSAPRDGLTHGPPIDEHEQDWGPLDVDFGDGVEAPVVPREEGAPGDGEITVEGRGVLAFVLNGMRKARNSMSAGGDFASDAFHTAKYASGKASSWTGRKIVNGVKRTGTGAAKGASVVARAGAGAAVGTSRGILTAGKGIIRGGVWLDDPTKPLANATIGKLETTSEAFVDRKIDETKFALKSMANVSPLTSAGRAHRKGKRQSDVDNYSNAGTASLDPLETPKTYSPTSGFGKKHRTPKKLHEGLPLSRYPVPGDPDYVPASDARTVGQAMAEVRGGLRADAIKKANLQTHELHSLYGHILDDRDRLEAELRTGNYTRGQKRAMRKAAAQVAKNNRLIESRHDSLDSQKDGTDAASAYARYRNR